MTVIGVDENGLLEHWPDVDSAHWAFVQDLIQWEEQVRGQRGLERRLGSAHLGKFKPLADFDWKWPASCDQGAVQERRKRP